MNTNIPSDTNLKPFKERKSFEQRVEEVKTIKTKFPNKVPVIVERFVKEKTLPLMDKTKFLVPQELTVSQFITILRTRLQINSNQSFYLLINNKTITSMSTSILLVYDQFKENDGFLYVTYASQEMFG